MAMEIAILFDHLRDHEEVVFSERRVCDDLFGVAAVAHNVIPTAQGHWGDRSHGFDALDIHFRKLLNESQNGIEFILIAGNLVFLDADAREATDTLNGGSVDRHGELQKAKACRSRY